MIRNYAKRTANEFNCWRNLFQRIWLYCIALPFLWLFYRVEVQGRENLPKDRRYIAAGNHISHFDPFFVRYAVKKPVAFMAKKELFEENGLFLMTMMDWLGAFAVNREKIEVSTIKTVKEVFKSKYVLGIFPEGGIIREREIGKINKGFAVIAKAAKWDIVPIAITGCEEYNWVPFKSKVIVRVGTPISHEISPDEIVERWGKQVSQMCGYGFCDTESENSEVQDQEDFVNA